MVQEVVRFLGGRSHRGRHDARPGRARRGLLASGVGRLVGVDRDPDALAIATERLASSAIASRPALRAVLRGLEVEGPVDGVLYDLGVSSLQLDDPERGFSYRAPGPLDMRMGPDARRAVETRERPARGGARRSHLRVRRGAPLPPRRRRDRAREVARARSRRPTSWPAWSRAPLDRTRGAPTPRAGRSRRSASRSTGSSRSSPPPCLGRSGSSLPAAASSPSPTTRSRTAS